MKLTLILLFIFNNSLGQLTQKADSLFFAGNYEASVNEYNKIIFSIAKNAPTVDLGNAYLRKGRSLFLLDQVDKALPDYFAALIVFEKLKNKERQAAAASNISSAYLKKIDYQQAEKFWQYAFDLSKNITDSIRILNLLNDKGLILSQKGDNRGAINLYKECIKNYNKQLTPQLFIQFNINLGMFYSKIDKDSSIFYYYAAEKFALKIQDSAKLSIIYGNIGYVYVQKKQFLSALPALQKSYYLNSKYGDILNTVYICNNLGDVYDSLHQYEKALFFIKKAAELNDTVFNQEKTKYAAELSEKYESGKKDEKIKSQETENKLKTRNLILSLSGLALVAALAIVSFISYRRKQKANSLLQTQNIRIEKLNENLDASNQVKTKLFSVISHDIRGPISSLYAYLQLNNKTPDKKDEPIIQQTEQLLDTLEDLLIWSKSQLHQFVPLTEKTDLNSLINNVVLLLDAAVQSKYLHIKNNIPGNILFYIQTLTSSRLCYVIFFQTL